MRNGKALKGHRRIRSANGISGRGHPPKDGWTVSCICGWRGGTTFRKAHDAQVVYRKHLDDEIDKPRICRVCGEQKWPDEMRSDYRFMCRVCCSKIGNDWQKINPEDSARHKRAHHLKKKFGISIEFVEQLLERQGGCCAVCQRPIKDSRGFAPHVDHDHETGVVRGILCFKCNSGLGSFNDDPTLLLAAVAYLARKRVAA